MPHTLFSCAGGDLVLPQAGSVLVGREDGGHLVVNPPRPVWDRSELPAQELRQWSCLVAAAGAAMLAELPALADGCINYWDAGNWALNEAADPPGPKTGLHHRRLHLHLLGRSPRAQDPDWRWGEAPRFPPFAERQAWAAPHPALDAEECVRVVLRCRHTLGAKYGFDASALRPWHSCPQCGYPTPGDDPVAPCPRCETAEA
jgi:hypothetical protein